MRIGVDATAIWKEPMGAHQYVAALTKGLLEIDDENDYVIYCRREIPEFLQPFIDRAEFRVSPFSNRKVCEQLWLSAVAPSDRLDLLHNAMWSLPLYYRGRTALTIYGLGWRLVPDMHPWSTKAYVKLTTERTVRKASRLISISEATKQTYVEHFGLSPDTIDVTHLGVDLDYFKNDATETDLRGLRSRYSLPERFILFVGPMFTHKNLDSLLHAFDRMRQRGFEGVGLVIAGKKALQYENLARLAANLGLADVIRFTGYFPAEDLPHLYQAAEVFAFPSLLEGFGIPILEAFASGTPVVTSNSSSMPEVAGDAALLVDPQEPEELANAMERALSDSKLRAELIEKGLARAREFSWRRTAEKTLESYRRTLDDPSPHVSAD